MIPAWTFVASAQAATLAGLIPYFVDVDPRTWTLEPDAIDDIVARAPGEVGAVMKPADIRSRHRMYRRELILGEVDAESRPRHGRIRPVCQAADDQS